MPHSRLNGGAPAQSWKVIKGELVEGVFEDSCRCSRIHVKTVRDSMSITSFSSMATLLKGDGHNGHPLKLYYKGQIIMTYPLCGSVYFAYPHTQSALQAILYRAASLAWSMLLFLPSTLLQTFLPIKILLKCPN